MKRNSQFNRIKLILMLVLSGFALDGNLTNIAEANGDATTDKAKARIEGVADFLIDRANDNYLYIFEKKMKDNKYFNTYFPNTYKLASDLGLREILVTDTSVWRVTIEKDIEDIRKRFKEKAKEQIAQKSDELILSFLDNLLKEVEGVSITIEGESYPLNQNVLGLGPDHIVNKTINSFWEPTNEVVSGFRNITGTFNKIIDKFEKPEESDVNKLISATNETLESLKKGEKIWKSALSQKQFPLSLNIDLIRIAESMEVSLNNIVEIADDLKIISDKNQHQLIRVNSTLNIIAFLVKNENLRVDRPQDLNRFNKQFEQFRRYVMFFTQLSEADSPDDTKAILKTYTLPPVSFGVKRKPKENRLTVSSYLGISAVNESANRDWDNTNTFASVVAPIGVELSHGYEKKNSNSILITLFDFGPAVNAKLYEQDKDVKMEDVIAPGIFLVYGWKDLPIATGIGYQHSKGIKTLNDREHHVMLWIAFDMPLFTLY